MLTKFDELTCHQIVATFDGPETSDRAFTEKMWFNLHDTAGAIVVAVGIGVYPNRNVMDGFACVNLGNRVQHNLRVSRELRPRIEDLVIGPLSVQVVEPFRKVHLGVAQNDQGIELDLDFLATVPPHEEQ